MRVFPNPVFQTSSFDKLYFFNTAVRGYSQEFYMNLLKITLVSASEIMVEEPIPDERFDDFLLSNVQHPNITKKFKNINEFKPWMQYATMHSTQCTVRNNNNSIQIYSDPHDWDVCIIGCKEADDNLVKDWLIKSGNYERRMKSIDEFYSIWHDIATPKMFDYAMLNLKENYLPFIE